MEYTRPVPGAWITATYRQHNGRKPPSVEPGVDYGSPVGTLVLSPAAGVVVWVGYSGAVAGNRVMIRFDDGNYGSGIHLSSTMGMRVGMRVAQRTVIGKVGIGGDGPHLHWSFWIQPARQPVPGLTAPQDFEAFLAGQSTTAGNGSTPFEGDDMTPAQDAALGVILKAVQDLVHTVIPDGAVGKGETVNRLRSIENTLAAGSGNPWDITLEHPISKAPTKAGDFLRYEAQEHENTRKAVAGISVTGGSVDVAALAAQIRAGLGAEVAAELAKRLAD